MSHALNWDVSSCTVVDFEAQADGAYSVATSRFSLLDASHQRRAAISHRCALAGLEVLPFESVADLLSHPRPGVPVLINDDGHDIAELISGMKATGAWMPLIAFSEDIHLGRVCDAVKRGVIDYLVWPFVQTELDAALRQIDNCDERLPTGNRDEVIAFAQIAKLTRREREVLEFVGQGLTNRLIAKRLDISPRTVEKYRETAIAKLNVPNSIGLLKYAFMAGIV